MSLSRRHWISTCAALVTLPQVRAALGHARAAAGSAEPKYEVLDPETALEIEAMSAQIIPSGDGAGAREAGVIYFIDRALATFATNDRAAYRDGLLEVQAKRKQLFPDATSIRSLADTQQKDLMHAIEQSSFFELLRTHTVLGFLGDPSYGGNRDQVGWKQIGFEHQMAFKPPFGYYDEKETAQ